MAKSLDNRSIDLQSQDEDVPQPPSPAPTYRSSYWTRKGPNPESPISDQKLNPKTNDHVFDILPDPLDTNHPLHATPSSSTRFNPPRKSHYALRIPRSWPWVLCLVFCLMVLWFASLFLSIKLFNKMRPVMQPSINVFVNPNQNGSTGTNVAGQTSSVRVATRTSVISVGPAETDGASSIEDNSEHIGKAKGVRGKGENAAVPVITTKVGNLVLTPTASKKFASAVPTTLATRAVKRG